MVLDRIREIRQGCLSIDPRATGLISVSEFRKVLPITTDTDSLSL